MKKFASREFTMLRAAVLIALISAVQVMGMQSSTSPEGGESLLHKATFDWIDDVFCDEPKGFDV